MQVDKERGGVDGYIALAFSIVIIVFSLVISIQLSTYSRIQVVMAHALDIIDHSLVENGCFTNDAHDEFVSFLSSNGLNPNNVDISPKNILAPANYGQKTTDIVLTYRLKGYIPAPINKEIDFAKISLHTGQSQSMYISSVVANPSDCWIGN